MGAERSQWQFPANEVGKVIGWSDEASPSNPSASKGLVNKGPFVEPDDIANMVETTDTDASGFGFVIDEDDMASDSATKVPTQQSVKAYVDAGSGSLLPRNLFSATIAAARADGSITFIGGHPYKTDSSATGEASLTYDLGVDGLVPHTYVTPRMCGAVGYTGAADAGEADDQEALQRAWVIAAAHNLPVELEGLNYNCAGELYTESNLRIAGYNSSIFFTDWGATGGFISNVWPSDPERRVQHGVTIEGLTVSGELLPAPTGTENSNLIGFARGMYGAKIINCTAKKMRSGGPSSPMLGGAGFGDELGSHDVVYVNCIVEDCWRGVRTNGRSGSFGDSADEPHSLTNQRFYNTTFKRCGTAIWCHAVGAGSGDWDVSNLGYYDAYFDGVTIEDCGHSPWTPFDFDANPTYSPQKTGVINFAGCRAVAIKNVRIKLNGSYTSGTDWLGRTGYPSSGNYIGAGLSGNVGALIWGWGRDNVVENVILDGNVDAYFNLNRAVNYGDIGTAPPSSITDGAGSGVVIRNLKHVQGSVAYWMDCIAGQTSGETQVSFEGLHPNAAPTGGILAPNASSLAGITMEVVHRTGARIIGQATALAAAGWGINTNPALTRVGGSLEASGDVTALGTLKGKAFSGTGATAGFQYAGTMATSVTATGATNHYLFYNPNGGVGSIQTNASATSFNTSSDERLKDDFRDFDGLGIVGQITAYDFAWRSGGRGIGVIAQHLSEIFPDAVSVGDTDEDWNAKGIGDRLPWAVDYSKLVPVLIKAVQQLSKRVDALGG